MTQETKLNRLIGSIERWMESGEPVLSLKYLLDAADGDLALVQESLNRWQNEERIEWIKPLDPANPNQEVVRFRSFLRVDRPWREWMSPGPPARTEAEMIEGQALVQNLVGAVERCMESGELALPLRCMLSAVEGKIEVLNYILQEWKFEGKIEWLKPLDLRNLDDLVVRFQERIHKGISLRPWPKLGPPASSYHVMSSDPDLPCAADGSKIDFPALRTILNRAFDLGKTRVSKSLLNLGSGGDLTRAMVMIPYWESKGWVKVIQNPIEMSTDDICLEMISRIGGGW